MAIGKTQNNVADMCVNLLMKSALLVLLSLLCATNIYARNDWAQYGRYQKENVQLQVKPKVVFMGNSITEFWVNKSPEFWKAHNDFVGRGIAGQTTCEMLARFHADVVMLRPHVVVILAGINDIAQNLGPISLENIMGNIESMVDIARANGIKVALCSVVPCNRFSWRPDLQPAEQVKRLNEMIARYVEEKGDKNVVYVDYHTAMANIEGGLNADLSQDGCHPTAKGYAIMERVVMQSLRKWLK